MKFKTTRIEEEFKLLDEKNPRLKEAALLLESIIDGLGLDEPTITCVYRDPTENGLVGGIDNSPHCVWEGMDFRSSIYKPDEIQDILKEINIKPYKYHNKPTMIYHKVNGGVPHFHLQILK